MNNQLYFHDLLQLLRKQLAYRISLARPFPILVKKKRTHELKEMAITFAEVAERAHIRQPDLRKCFVVADKTPTLEQCDKVLQALNITLSDLLPKSDSVVNLPPIDQGDPRRSALAINLQSIFGASDELMRGIAGKFRKPEENKIYVLAGKIQQAAESIYNLYEVGDDGAEKK